METDIMQRIKQWKYKQDLPTQKREGKREEGEKETESHSNRDTERETEVLKRNVTRRACYPYFTDGENQ